MTKEEELKQLLGIYDTFDFTIRKFATGTLDLYLIFNAFLVDTLKVSRLVVSLVNLKDQLTSENYQNILENHFIAESLTVTEKMDELSDAILNGDLGIIVDNQKKLFYVETKQYPSRSLSEPDSERVVRGSRDGFTENMHMNIGLIRRRIKNGNLAMKLYEIGTISKTKVVLLYLKDVIDKKILDDIEERLQSIKVKELTMSDKALEELLLNNSYTPYPLVKYTERPDTLAMHLYQGMFGILVDTSPSAILGPITIFDHLQHAEEYRQTVVAGSYLRCIRLIGIMIAFFSIPLWYALTSIYDSLPIWLQSFMPENRNHFILFFQLILIEVGIELIRMASIHTPSALSTSMGLVAGIIIGDMAIQVGLFNEQIVILGAISAIGSYITPSYELSLANKMAKLFLVVLVFCFFFPGFIIGTICLFVYLACLKSFGRPYLYPLFPFSFRNLYKQFFRLPYVKKEKTRKRKNHSA